VNLWIIVIDLWKIQDFLLQFYLLDTPPFIVIMLCGLCTAYTARFGVKSVFRAAEGLFYISMLSFIIIPFLVQSNVEWFLIQGFLTQFDLRSAWQDGYYIGSIFGETALIIYIYPYLSKPERTPKTVIYLKAITVLLIVIHLIIIILVIGPDLAANLNYPELEMIRLIRSGSYLETLDPIIIALWLISIFIKMSFMLLISGQIIAKIFKLKHDESMVYPLATIVGVAAICLAKSPLQFIVFNSSAVTACFYIIECIPLLYYAVDLIRGKSMKKGKEERS
jgi:spore germination protein KB